MELRKGISLLRAKLAREVFSRYVIVGLLNTVIHWSVFFLAFYVGRTDQALGNFIAFSVAVTFSFFANARFTFKADVTTLRYIMYIFFMGGVSYIGGWIAERFEIPPVITLLALSVISLGCGFFYAKIIVFKCKDKSCE